jgi:predicted PurR-regulated permease PerM
MSATREAGSIEDAGRPESAPWSSQTKIAVGVGLAFGALIALWIARGALPLLALAGIIAFLVAPIVRWLHRRLRTPRWLALLVAYVFVFAVSLIIALLLAYGVTTSVTSIDYGSAVDTTRDWAQGFVDWGRDLEVFGVEVDLQEIMSPIEEWLAGEDAGAQGEAPRIRITTDQLEAILGGAFFSIKTVAGLIAAVVASALVTLMVSIYLNADSQKLHTWVFRTVPDGYDGDAAHLADRFGRIWRGYVYGQLINSLITGFLVFLALWAVGLPGALLMGLIMMIFNMIPTFGPIIAAIPGILAALIGGSTRFDIPNVVFALIVAGIYVVVVQAQANVIAPKVMGAAVRLSPVVVLISLVVGFQIAGLIGSLLAVPIVATVKEVFSYLYNKLLDRDPFAQERGSPPVAAAASAGEGETGDNA